MQRRSEERLVQVDGFYDFILQAKTFKLIVDPSEKP
jgi:hypothetical protein